MDMSAKPIRHLLLWLIASGFAASHAQQFSYTLLGSSGSQPSPRIDGTIAYDATDRTIYLFGGQDSAARNDLWAYSLATRQWAEIAVTGTRPAARFGHTLVFDSVRRRVVVFGGQSAGFFSDVWAYSITAGAWSQLSPNDAGPNRRYGHSGIYDTARDRLVISHGFTDEGRFDDTWAFDFSNNTWRDISPASNRPVRRCLHHAAHDQANGRMYLYGGCASPFGPCPLGDLWSFDLTQNRWTQIATTTAPPARQHYGMEFDAVRGRLIIFGGSGNGVLNDTWEFNPAASTWQLLPIQGTPPEPRSRHQAAYANDRGNLFFFGGRTLSGPTNELWMLGPGFLADTPQASAAGVVNAFSFMGGTVAPGEIVSIFGENLGPLNGVAFAFDPITGELPRSGPGVTVTWNGIAAPLYFAHANQLNVQAPYELAGAPQAELLVTVNGQTSQPVTIPAAGTHLGLFPAVWNQDLTLNSPANPAAQSGIIVVYASGQGVTVPPSRTGAYPGDVLPEPAAGTTLQIGGMPAEILFRGQTPGTAGVMQVNARLPHGLAAGSSIPLVLEVGGVQSQQGVTVAVR